MYAGLSLEGLTGAPDGSLIRLDRDVYGLVAVCLDGGPKIVNELLNVSEPCLFSKFAEGNEPGEHGGVTPRCSSVGVVLWTVI